MNNTAVPASPAAVWQTLLAYLLQQHYGLTLNDTEFSDERVIEACLCRGISLCEALNTFAEKYALVRTDRRNNTRHHCDRYSAGTEGNRPDNSPQQLCHPQTRYRIKSRYLQHFILSLPLSRSVPGFYLTTLLSVYSTGVLL